MSTTWPPERRVYETLGSSHVNALHSQWLDAITRGSSLFGLRPLHYSWIGSIKPKNTLRSTTLFGKVGNVDDENLPTTLVIAFIPVRINPIAQVPSIGDMVPSNKLLEPEYLFHYVSPMQSQWLSEPFAEFEVVSPDRDIFDQLLRWAPDSAGEPDSAVPPNPLLRNVSRATPGKFPLKLESNPDATGQPAEDATELDAWIVWAEGNMRNKGTPTIDRLVGNKTTIGGQTSGEIFWRPSNVQDAAKIWQFECTIQPPAIITGYNDGSDVPELAGNKLTPDPVVPGTGQAHPIFGSSTPNGGLLENGASSRWDVSRQMQVHILNPNLIPKDDFLAGYNLLYETQPHVDSVPIMFPADPCVGNDDPHTGDEDNDPYHAFSLVGAEALHHPVGVITSVDGPSVWMSSVSAAAGRSYTETSSFREFARLQLANQWYRISDDVSDETVWSSTLSIDFDSANSAWKDAGSTTDP